MSTPLLPLAWVPGPMEIVFFVVALIPVGILLLLAAHLLGPLGKKRSSRKGAAKGALFPFVGPHDSGPDAGPGDTDVGDGGGGPADGGGAGL